MNLWRRFFIPQTTGGAYDVSTVMNDIGKMIVLGNLQEYHADSLRRAARFIDWFTFDEGSLISGGMSYQAEGSQLV